MNQTIFFLGLVCLSMLPASVLETALAAAPPDGKSNHVIVYFGTYTRGTSKGIYVYRLNLESGTLTPIGTTGGIKNPSFQAIGPNGRFLYSVSESRQFKGRRTGAITALAIDPKTGLLKQINEQPSVGTGPCHVQVDHLGRHVLAANYGSGSVVVLPTRADGGLAAPSSFVQHHGSSTHSRQKAPHAHGIYCDANDQFVVVPDLGLDKVLIYKYDPRQGTLKPNDAMPYATIAPGSGPRHFAFHPSGNFGYVINELSSTITAFAYNGRLGTLKTSQTVSTLPPGFQGNNTTAEIVVSADGRFVYGSNRGHDSVVVFAIDPSTGKLEYVSNHKTGGHSPRNFAIDPSGSYLLAANQDSDNVVVFRIDRESGKLLSTGKVIEIPKPVCITMVRL